MSSTQELVNGKWQDAHEEPYHPSIFEKIWHLIGGHIWTIGTFPKTCVMCGKIKRREIHINKTSGGVMNNDNGYTHTTVTITMLKVHGNGDSGQRSAI